MQVITKLEKGDFVKLSEDELYRVVEDLRDSTSPFVCELEPLHEGGKNLKLTKAQVQTNLGTRWKKIVNLETAMTITSGP